MASSSLRADDDTTPGVAALDGPATVGLLGDPANLIFKGSTPFPDADIRWAISADLQTQLAAEPSAPLQDYLDTLDRRLRAGFRRAGYFRPSVSIKPDIATGKILVSLDPATRYRCGQIKVEGAKTLPVDLLIKRLTNPATQPFFACTLDHDSVSLDETAGQQDTSSAAWTVGDPAPFDDLAASMLPEQVRVAMAGLGYFDPQIEVSVAPAGKVATMNIRVLDEGPKAAVDRIDVKGLKRNRQQDVIDYLKVKPGDSMDLDRLLEMQQHLWNCGRFRKHAISITRRPEDPSKVILQIDLEEIDHLPLLTEPLSPVDQVALRVRQWLFAVGDGKEDLLLEYELGGSTYMIAVNGMYGVVARMQVNATAKPSMGDDNDIAAVLTTDLFGIYLPNAHLEVVAPTHGRNTAANIAIQPETDPAKPGKWSVSLGWGMTAAVTDNPTQPLALSMRLPPAAFLDFAHQEGYSYELRDGVLTIIGPVIKARFDAGTGRPLEMESLKSKDLQIRLQADVGVVKKQGQDFQTTMAAPNIYDPQKPIGSFIAFVVQVICHAPVLHNSTTEQRTRLAAVVSHILTPDAFKTLDDFIDSPTTEPSDNPFTLPAPARDMKTSTGIMAMMGEYALPFTDIVFARGTWPSTLSRLTCFALTGHSESLEAELGQLSVSPDTGPLASLVAAELLSNASPLLSKYFAERGLRDLSTAAFVKDIQSVLKRNAAGSQFITTVLKNIQNLDQSDLDSLGSSFSPNTAKAVLAGIEELRAQKNSPPDVALQAALGRAWDAGLRNVCETQLNGLANPTPTTQP